MVYVNRLLTFQGNSKKIIYMNETNVNLFLRRKHWRSKKGTRCSVKSPTSRGKNIHIIGAISQTELSYWERRRGSYRKEDCCEWMRRCLRTTMETENPQNICVVCDSAPCHVSLEDVFQEEEFAGANLLRLGPYSAPLNPIEECWSIVKSSIKQIISNSLENIKQTSGYSIWSVQLRFNGENYTQSSAFKLITVCRNIFQGVHCLAMKNLALGGDVPEVE